jgi:hypothetical protein
MYCAATGYQKNDFVPRVVESCYSFWNLSAKKLFQGINIKISTHEHGTPQSNNEKHIWGYPTFKNLMVWYPKTVANGRRIQKYKCRELFHSSRVRSKWRWTHLEPVNGNVC